MQNNNNIIKPVEQSQDITRLNTINRREKRKQKFNLGSGPQQENKDTDKKNPQSKVTEKSELSSNTVDYKA